jgi:hypothetical protein
MKEILGFFWEFKLITFIILLFLSPYILGLLGLIKELLVEFVYGLKRKSELLTIREKDLNLRESQITKLEADLNRKLIRANYKLTETLKTIDIIVSEKKEGFPWVANAISDYHHLLDLKIAEELRIKDNPALKGAEQVTLISKKKKEVEKEYYQTKYLLDYYEELFPWLADFREIDDEIIKNDSSSLIIYDNNDPASYWLNENEYKKLTVSERNQVALDRYNNRKKSNWEIGRDYERYIGYLYEKEGYNVSYQGIIKGYEDLGRDLIAKKDNQSLIIQCKYWAKHKTIHEKYVYQLFGTTVEFFIDKETISCNNHYEKFNQSLKNESIKPVFVTSIGLSETALKVADILSVEVRQNVPLNDYPQIKCNVSTTTNEKIYHLPFDQQYDKVIIEPEKGEFYAKTVKEAEKMGFRRSYKWRGN